MRRAAVLSVLLAGSTTAVIATGAPAPAPTPASRGAWTRAAWTRDREPPRVLASGLRTTRVQPMVEDAHDLPAGWRGTRDRDTGVVATLWGSYVSVPGASREPAIAERAARAFVAQHLALLAPGSAATDLVTITNRVDGALRTVAFQQQQRGMRVVGGQLHVVFAHDRLFAAGSQALPDVRVAATPTRAGAGRAIAWLAAETQRAVVQRGTTERVVLPLIHGPGDLEYRVADRIELATSDGLGVWDVYVAPDGTPLLRESRVRSATGTLRFDAGVRHPTGARMAYPAARANVTIDGVASTSDAAGLVTWSGTASGLVTPTVSGAQVNVIDDGSAGSEPATTLANGGTLTVAHPTEEARDALLSAFVHVTRGKEHARVILPSLASWLDQPLDVHVNGGTSCNASFADDALHFFKADATCENTARLADVVYHELGHAVHFHAVIAGVGLFQPALSEGLADFFAADLVDEPALGRGFGFDDLPVRDIDPAGLERVYPDDLSSSPHLSGLILSGALWDLRKALIAQLGEAAGRTTARAIFAGVMQRAPNFAGAYLAALVADDDDGDLGNGTPHGCAIEAAFGKHGLAGASFTTTRIDPPIVDGLQLALPVTVPTGAACTPPQVTGATITWQVAGGAPSTVAMTAGDGRWTGALPPQPDGTLVTYAVTAVLDDQSTVVFPQNPADPRYQLYVGPVDELWCERFEGDPQWAQRGAQLWQVATPLGGAGGDPTRAATGTLALGTSLVGDGRYEASAVTAIETPMIDASGYDQVRLQYRRWLTVEDALYDQATLAINGTPVWTNARSEDGTRNHRDREWRFHDVDVTAYAGAPIGVSWALASDASGQFGGWTLDDVCLVGVGKRAVCGDGVLDDGETCDDGNTHDGDACDATCGAVEDPGCCAATATPAGPVVLSLGVLGLLVLRPRRRRHHPAA